MAFHTAFFGPIVSSAIIDTAPSHNSSTPFYFLIALNIASLCVIVFFLNVRKSRIEQEDFLDDKRKARLELKRKLTTEDP